MSYWLARKEHRFTSSFQNTQPEKKKKEKRDAKTGASNASKEKKQRKRGIKMMIFDAKLKAMRQYCYSIFMTGKHSPQLALEM